MLVLLIGTLLSVQPAAAQEQDSLLRAGPMLGHVEMQEANLWLQTTKAVEITLVYWESENPQSKLQYHAGTTGAGNSYVKQITLSNLKYGTRYRYALYLDGHQVIPGYPLQFTTQQLWQYRTDPPAFSFAIGSCLYVNDRPYDRPGEPYGSSLSILQTITEQHPDIMIWMGDNVYYREPDFYSKERLDYRYADARGSKEIQRLLAGSVNLATWDDHDYGPNDSDRSYRLKTESLDIFKRYWANPSYGNEEAKGVFTRYLYNDVEFFLTDDRYHRAPNELRDSSKDFFGEEQLQWLKDGLVSSEASFKIIVVGNQVTNEHSTNESMATYEEEYRELTNFLTENDIDGVLILSGDRHFTQLLKTEREDTYPLYEYTSSPLSAGIYGLQENDRRLDNPKLVKGSLFVQHNFGLLSVSGERGNRKLRIQTIARDGEQLWERTITQQELSGSR